MQDTQNFVEKKLIAVFQNENEAYTIFWMNSIFAHSLKLFNLKPRQGQIFLVPKDFLIYFVLFPLKQAW